MLRLLKDEDEGNRFAAATALGEIGPEAIDAIRVLGQALEDESESVQQAASDALDDILFPEKPQDA